MNNLVDQVQNATYCNTRMLFFYDFGKDLICFDDIGVRVPRHPKNKRSPKVLLYRSTRPPRVSEGARPVAKTFALPRPAAQPSTPTKGLLPAPTIHRTPQTRATTAVYGIPFFG